MKKKTRTEYSLLNIATGLGGYAVNTVVGLICRVVFTRALSAEYLGVSGLFTNILSMLSLAELGIGSAIVYALYKPLAEDDHEKIASLVHFYGKCYRVIGIVVAVAGLALMPFLNVLIREQPAIQESLYLIYGIYLFNTANTYFFSYRSSLIMAAQQNYVVTGVNYLITVAQSVLQIIWLVVTHEYLGFLIIQSIGTLAYNVIVSYIAKRKFPYITGKNIKPLEKNERKGLVRNVQALGIWKLSGLLVNSTDNIIITFFSGLAMVGLSSNYTLLSSTLNSLINQLFNGVTASVGNMNAIESKEKKLSVFYALNLANFWVFGWAAIGIFVVSTNMVHLLFGADYVLPLNIPFVIALNFSMVGMQNAVWTYKNTLGLFRPGRDLLIITAAINLICSICLGKIWGLFGILLATAISRALTNTWYDPYAVFKYGLQEKVSKYFVRYGFYAVVLVFTGGVCVGICSLFHFSLLTNTILNIIVCCIVPNVVFLLCFSRLAEFQYFKNLALSLVKRVLMR